MVGLAFFSLYPHLDGTVQLSEGETYTEKDYKSDITTTYVQTGLKLAKVYAPAVTLGAVSLGCMFGSHHIMSKAVGYTALVFLKGLVQSNISRGKARIALGQGL